MALSDALQALPSSRRQIVARIGVGSTPTAWSAALFTNAQIWSLSQDRPVSRVVSLGGYEYPYWPDVALPGQEDWTFMSFESWYWDDDKRLLYVWHASASPPNDPSGDAMVVDSYLHFSEFQTIYGGIDPELEPTGSIEYQPRLSQDQTISQSWENVLAGILTISDSSIRMINADNYFQQFGGPGHSFSDREVRIWVSVNGLGNIERIYDGKISGISFSENYVTFNFYDALSALNAPCYMGDPALQVIRQSSATHREQDTGAPVKFVHGLCSYAKYLKQPSIFEVISPEGTYQLDDAEVAACQTFTPTLTTSNNRQWSLCRVGPLGLRTQSIGPVQLETVFGGVRRYVRFAYHDLRPGEYVQWTNGGNFYFALVLKVGTFTQGANTYNCRLLDFGAAYPLIGAGASTINPMSVPIVEILQADGSRYRIRPADYTRSYLTTTGGNKIVIITFFNNFEANYTGLTTLDPNSHVVQFVAMPGDLTGPGDVVRRMLEASGLSCDTTSFAAVDSALGLRALFTSPFVGESSYLSYREYVQEVLKSVGAYLRVSGAGLVEMKLLAAPSTSAAISGDEIEGIISTTLDFGDVIYELLPNNPHIPTWMATNFGDNPETTASSATTLQLHRNAKSSVFGHILETITSRVAYLLALRSSPRVTYQFKTATAHLDAVLGDDVTIDTGEVLGGVPVNLKVSGLDKSAGGVVITATEIP